MLFEITLPPWSFLLSFSFFFLYLFGCISKVIGGVSVQSRRVRRKQKVTELMAARHRENRWERSAKKIIKDKALWQTSSCPTLPPVPIWLLIHQLINSTFLTLWIVTLWGSNNLFRGVAYQLHCFSDIYIKICSSCKITVLK